ncbi:MAG TPA: phenylalanine--tRNA ligase subunit beta [Candidatus Atribacteria bacterium]|nr:phenylalanine--tRNA ligase subunit beta [Candidatus Atribacteria bacterium]
MRISYNILKRFLPGLDIPQEELAPLLTEQGLMVERTWKVKELFPFPLVVATLKRINKGILYSEGEIHYQGRVWKIKVNNWGMPEEGSKIILGMEGEVPHFLPWGGEGKEEIIDFLITLPFPAEEGEEVSALLLGDDIVLDVEITANRGDCLSSLGLAREVGAKLGLEWQIPPVSYEEADTPSDFSLENQAPDLCPYYTGKHLVKLSIRPSPWWVVKELSFLGLRPINNVVDFTNLVMMEIGQPLHAFDASVIKGRKVVVRRAEEGEKLITLDGIERELSSGMLVIADAERPIGLAGIMGGKESEITSFTSEVFLEAAIFDRVAVRKTAKALGLRTEASARFERGVDPERVIYASGRVLQLLGKDGESAPGWFIAGTPPREEREVSFFPEEVEKTLGCSIKREEMIKILVGLGFGIKSLPGEETIQVKVPSWRSDIYLPVDIAEEVGRIYGYDKIISCLPQFSFDPGNQDSNTLKEEKLRRHLVDKGLKEIISFPLISPRLVELWGEKEEQIEIKNPLSQEQSYLRPCLLLSALEVLKVNITRGRNNWGLFETGKVFRKGVDTPFQEEKRLFIALTGYSLPPLWQRGGEVDIFLLKGLIEELLEIAGFSREEVRFENDGGLALEPSCSFRVKISGKEAGRGGLLSSSWVRELGFWGKIYVAELSLDLLTAGEGKVFRLKEVVTFPSIARDISILVDETTKWGEIEEMVKRTISREKMEVEEIEIFDLFKGENVPEGKKNFSFRIIFRSPERTLNDEEVDKWVQKIKADLKEKRGLLLREELVNF